MQGNHYVVKGDSDLGQFVVSIIKTRQEATIMVRHYSRKADYERSLGHSISAYSFDQIAYAIKQEWEL